MESSTTARGVDVAARATHPVLALVLALISVPGSIMTWDELPGGGFVWGLPFAIVAVALGVQARSAGNERGKATAAIVIGGLMAAMTIIWTLVAVITD